MRLFTLCTTGNDCQAREALREAAPSRQDGVARHMLDLRSTLFGCGGSAAPRSTCGTPPIEQSSERG